jgi:hypothetical protein
MSATPSNNQIQEIDFDFGFTAVNEEDLEAVQDSHQLKWQHHQR